MSAVLASPLSNRLPTLPPAFAATGLVSHPGIWRGRTGPSAPLHTQATGHAELDALLPGGGWAFGSLTEILIENDGLGELGLLMPALAALTRARRRVALINPPYLPQPSALAAFGVDTQHLVQIDASSADSHWSAEQCLRAGCCASVLHWLPHGDYRQLRRLQLAAESGHALGFVFRPLQAEEEASPAALRIKVFQGKTGSCMEVLKCRGIMDQRFAGTLPLRPEPTRRPATSA